MPKKKKKRSKSSKPRLKAPLVLFTGNTGQKQTAPRQAPTGGRLEGPLVLFTGNTGQRQTAPVRLATRADGQIDSVQQRKEPASIEELRRFIRKRRK